MAAPQQTAPGRADSPGAQDGASTIALEAVERRGEPKQGAQVRHCPGVGELAAGARAGRPIRGLVACHCAGARAVLPGAVAGCRVGCVRRRVAAAAPAHHGHHPRDGCGLRARRDAGCRHRRDHRLLADCEKSIYPLILFAQVIPKIAIAPLLVVWFGFGMASEDHPRRAHRVLPGRRLRPWRGFDRLIRSCLELSSTMGASRWKTFRKIRFPNVAAAPDVGAEGRRHPGRDRRGRRRVRRRRRGPRLRPAARQRQPRRTPAVRGPHPDVHHRHRALRDRRTRSKACSSRGTPAGARASSPAGYRTLRSPDHHLRPTTQRGYVRRHIARGDRPTRCSSHSWPPAVRAATRRAGTRRASPDGGDVTSP